MTTTASISSGNVYDSNNLNPKKVQAKDFSFKHKNNLTNQSNEVNMKSRDSGTSPSIHYTRAALLKLKESTSTEGTTAQI